MNNGHGTTITRPNQQPTLVKVLVNLCPDLCRHAVWLCAVLLMTWSNAYPQQETHSVDTIPEWSAQQTILRFGDTVIIINQKICKGYYSTRYFLQRYIVAQTIAAASNHQTPIKKPFLRVQGNVHYDYLYRSFIDTPFTQNDFQQHTIQTYLTVTVKDKYPMKVNLSRRISNSPYFRDFLDINMRFDKNTFVRNAKQQLLDKITGKIWQRPDLAKAEAELKALTDKYNELKIALNDPDLLQRIVEERERALYKKVDTSMPDINTRKLYKLPQRIEDNIKPDSSTTEFIDRKKAKLDSIETKMQRLHAKTDSIKNRINKDLATIRRKVYQATHPRDLTQIAREQGVSPDKKEGIEKFLSNVRTIGIGRSVLNYSELTAWNVALTGINLEYSDGIYAAVAAGKIDYGFRDFLGKNTRQKGQTFFMGRVGWGNPDRKAVIVSAFTGKKFNYSPVIADTIKDYIPVTGYSIEGILKKDENTGLQIELAKTTIPVTGTANQQASMKPLFVLSNRANLGISIKGQTLLHNTDTRINGFFRKTGEQFQSFSLFTVNTDQTAWLVNVDQPFFHNKLGVVASLRRNDFTNPFSEKTFKSSTIFTSVQATARIPKWPVVTVGYYPGTQLYIVNKERIRENAYYIMNGALVHNYTAGGIRMLSSLLYNKYSSKGTDTGFIAYKGVSYMASHSFLFSKLQLQGMYMYTDQEQMRYYTLDANADYTFSSVIKAGVGVKQNKIAGGASYMGSRVQLGLQLKKLGELQWQYEKSYLPTIWQSLYPVETGRVSWTKFF